MKLYGRIPVLPASDHCAKEATKSHDKKMQCKKLEKTPRGNEAHSLHSVKLQVESAESNSKGYETLIEPLYRTLPHACSMPSKKSASRSCSSEHSSGQ